VAIKGANFDGEAAAADMLEKGAAAVIIERRRGDCPQSPADSDPRYIIVENARFEFAKAASEFYGNPTGKLKLIAVTGTNGKTTVATLIKTIIESNGHKCGFIGTTEYDTCGKKYESVFSTPRQDELYRLFAEMVENGAEFCVMEASSQALDQYRIAGESFEVGIFTNLTQDHLDWHKTMENYYQAKKRLFTMCKTALICVDDEWGKKLSTELEHLGDKNFSYSINDKASYNFKCNMPGEFNIANSIAAIKACGIIGFDLAKCCEIIESVKGVRGRCEVIYDGDFSVICDYAHTEDALEKILTCVRQSMIDGEFTEGRIICLFGAAGERDSEKRPLMGAVAAKYADFLVITSDNPRFEDQQKIIDEVEAGCSDAPRKTFTDRRDAIAYAISIAEKGDVILLAGKGHETCQVIGDVNEPFDERKIVNEIMEG
jgi:UDP-N-acetylmuramoyl-L-alanyl-D-glutamate--2,6-diaminopimelate ligase